jgi:hypothetical protein
MIELFLLSNVALLMNGAESRFLKTVFPLAKIPKNRISWPKRASKN